LGYNAAMRISLDYINLTTAPSAVDVKSDFVLSLTQLLKELGVPSPPTRAIVNCLFERMSDTGLLYHNPVHVMSMFQFADNLSINLGMAQQLTIWFHDAIYVPGSTINEINSADFMKALLQPFISTEVGRQAYSGILSTSLHLLDDVAKEDCLVMDLDLSMFAYSPYTFAVACTNIQKEFTGSGKCDQTEWIRGRRIFLNEMLEKPIFRTPLFYERCEKTARINIATALASLG
jgi:predicted metal-dependent HD superfamily phosphohydrolase